MVLFGFVVVDDFGVVAACNVHLVVFVCDVVCTILCIRCKCPYVRDTFCQLPTFYVLYVQYSMYDSVYMFYVSICTDTFCRSLTFYVAYVESLLLIRT